MTRKDTILIAVVINAGLLAILFATAIIYDVEEEEMVQSEFVNPQTEMIAISEPPPYRLTSSLPSEDIVDNILNHYQTAQLVPEKEPVPPIETKPNSFSAISTNEQKESSKPNFKKSDPLKKDVAKEVKLEKSQTEVAKPVKSNEPLYHVVKSGDNPWKIAKQYGVKYDDILRLNHLNEEKARSLKIGDRIRVK